MTSQLEHTVASYAATLSQAMPQQPCALASYYVLPGLALLRQMRPSEPGTLLAVIDLQNMLLQATWQPTIAGSYLDTMQSWTSWWPSDKPRSSPQLAMRRMLSTSLSTNLTRLWQSLLGYGSGAMEGRYVVSALARLSLISEICDYDILRRSLLPSGAPLLDVKALQGLLFEAAQTPELSTRAALQLSLLAWRLAVFEPCPQFDRPGTEPLCIKRFAQLHEALNAASACIWFSALDDDVEQGGVQPRQATPTAKAAVPQSEALALRRAQALTELVAATWAYRRGVQDMAEQ